MSFQANVFNVMIASPGDVAAERELVTTELFRWNAANGIRRQMLLHPIKWETHSSPEMGAHPQHIINDNLLSVADIVVGLFGTRIGTATPDYVSGTVEEIKRHAAAGKLVMLYFSKIPVDPYLLDTEQMKAVKEFRTECKNLGLYSEFESLDSLKTDFAHHLAIELNKPKYVWITPPLDPNSPKKVQLSPQAVRLLLAASNDRNGQILAVTTMSGFSIQTNGEDFAENTSRSAAMWKSVLAQLEQLGYITQLNEQVYELTQDGYERADVEMESAPVNLEVSVEGPANAQKILVVSNRPISIEKVEFLTSSEAQISSMSPPAVSALRQEVPIEHAALVKLYKAPRSDRNGYDLSGPAKARLTVLGEGLREQVVLPVLLQPQTVNSTQWITITGSQSFLLG